MGPLLLTQESHVFCFFFKKKNPAVAGQTTQLDLEKKRKLKRTIFLSLLRLMLLLYMYLMTFQLPLGPWLD